MPTRAQLVERFAATDIEALQEVLASDEYTDEAKEVAREQLLARGISGPPMRGAGHVGVARAAVKKKPLVGSPAALVSVWLVTRALMVIVMGLMALAFGVAGVDGLARVGPIGLGLGLCAAGGMLIWRRAFLRWIAIAAFVIAYGQLALYALTGSSDENWYRLVRWLPVLLISVATLSLVRTREELAAKDG
jgi:hypothetical protein